MSRRFGVRLLLEGGERGGPELVEVSANGIESSGVELIHSAGAFRAIDHEPSVLEDPEVLRYGWSADRKNLGQRPNGERPFPKVPEDGPAGRIPEGIELGVSV